MSLKKNVIYLVLMQAVNYIAPLVLVPYLTRILGVEKYGVLGLAITVSQYLILLTDFGFNFTASRKIAQFKDSKVRVSQIFWTIISAKFLMMIVSFGLIVPFVVFSEKLNPLKWEIFLVSLSVVASVIIPSWLFQGLEKVTVFSGINIFSKILIVPLVFIFVKSKEDLLIACLLQGGVQVFSGIISILYVKYNNIISFKVVRPKLIFIYLKESLSVFLGNLSISLYTLSTPLVLALMGTTYQVGLYSATDRIRGAAIGIFIVVGYAIFPRVSYLFKKNPLEANVLLKKIIFIFSILGCLGGVLVYSIADEIVLVAFGNQYLDSAILLKIMAPMFLLIPLSIIMANHLLLPNGFKKEYAKNSVIVCLLHMTYVFPLCKYYGAVGGSYSILISEIISFILLIFWTIKNNLLKKVFYAR
ncbi:O160 family O-antigen flippase [Escherichia coli]|nr:O160 family O-antigen flippase [Escherichia coli]MCV8917909.1 O160 family O-antigen flippase [Escherichia coli]